MSACLLACALASTGGCASLSTPSRTIQAGWLAPGLDAREWPTFAHDSAHTGLYPPQRGASALQGHIVWHVSAGGPVFSSPVLANDELFVGSTGGNLLALDAATGAVRWRHPIGQYLNDATPVVVGRVVFGVANRSQVYALDRTTGASFWSVDLHEVIQAPPTYAEGLLLLNARTTTVALDAATGAVRWRFHENGSGWPTQAAATVQGQTVYIAQGTTNVVYALDLRTGARRWSHDAGDRLISTPVISGQLVICGTWNGKLLALESATGAMRWTYDVNHVLPAGAPQDGIAGSPATTQDLVIVGTYSGNALALDAASGHLRWLRRIASPVLGVPVVGDATLYISGGQTLSALNISTGSPLWNLALGDIRGDLALGPGRLFAGDVQGNVYAVA